jgi:hypothetical protein
MIIIAFSACRDDGVTAPLRQPLGVINAAWAASRDAPNIEVFHEPGGDKVQSWGR